MHHQIITSFSSFLYKPPIPSALLDYSQQKRTIANPDPVCPPIQRCPLTETLSLWLPGHRDPLCWISVDAFRIWRGRLLCRWQFRRWGQLVVPHRCWKEFRVWGPVRLDERAAHFAWMLETMLVPRCPSGSRSGRLWSLDTSHGIHSKELEDSRRQGNDPVLVERGIV